MGPSFAPGHRVSPGQLPTERQPWNAHFLGGSCLQTLVDSLKALLASLLPGRGCSGLYNVQLCSHGKTARPPGPMSGAMPSHPNGQLGGAKGEHTAQGPPLPSMQAATCPGWVVCGVC